MSPTDLPQCKPLLSALATEQKVCTLAACSSAKSSTSWHDSCRRRSELRELLPPQRPCSDPTGASCFLGPAGSRVSSSPLHALLPLLLSSPAPTAGPVPCSLPPLAPFTEKEGNCHSRAAAPGSRSRISAGAIAAAQRLRTAGRHGRGIGVPGSEPRQPAGSQFGCTKPTGASSCKNSPNLIIPLQNFPS